MVRLHLGVVVVFSPTLVMELPLTTHRGDDAEHEDGQTTHEQDAAYCVSGQLGPLADPHGRAEDGQADHRRYDDRPMTDEASRLRISGRMVSLITSIS